MSIRRKLLILIVFVALVPLGVSATTALRIHQRALRVTVEQLHARTAEFAGNLAEQRFNHIGQSLSILVGSTIPWESLADEEEQAGALRLIYEQFDDIAVVSLVDAQGRGIGAPQFQQPGAGLSSKHPAVDNEAVKAFSQNIPFAEAQKNSVVMGDVFRAGSLGPMVAIVVSVPAGDRFVLVGLSIVHLCKSVSEHRPQALQLMLVNESGTVVCGPEELKLNESIRKAIPERGTRVVEYESDDGRMLAAISSLPMANSIVAHPRWIAIAQQSTATAFSASRRIQFATVFWMFVSLVAALVGGLVLSQSIHRPVLDLVEGAMQMARGNFSYTLKVTDGSELGELSHAFNYMGTQISKRDAEITAFNEELQDRVDQRTSELREAQDQLLQTQKVAAVSSLGAGIAHEINNPLTAVLGFTQLLRARASKEERATEAELLGSVEEQALRIRDIVATLQSLSETYAGDRFESLSADELLDSAIELVAGRLGDAHIELKRSIPSPSPKVMGIEARLRQAFLHILNNAVTAMPKGGELEITISVIDNKAVRISIQDTGVGMPPEVLERIFDPFFTLKEEWTGTGLGLTEAFRIVEEHHGSIKAESTPGVGTTVNVVLPTAMSKAHLE